LRPLFTLFYGEKNVFILCGRPKDFRLNTNMFMKLPLERKETFMINGSSLKRRLYDGFSSTE